jgi:hypothetical protein
MTFDALVDGSRFADRHCNGSQTCTRRRREWMAAVAALRCDLPLDASGADAGIAGA